MDEQVKNLREDLAGKILNMIKTGNIGQWLKEWRAQVPFNAANKKAYNGINSMYLSFTGHGDPRFMTYKQAQDKGFQVKDGAQGYRVEFWRFFDRGKVEKETDKKIGFVARCYTVFNAEQIDGIPVLKRDETQEIKTVERAEEIIKGCPVAISYGGERAGYSTKEDRIQMPFRNSFFTDYSFYAAMFHEMAHSTGSPTRLNRSKGEKFGDNAYALEELVAEFCSAFVGIEAGINCDTDAYDQHLRNHAAYIKEWSEGRFNTKRILNAISQAKKAANMIKGWGE